MIDKEKLIDLFTQYEYETLYVKDGEYAVFSSGTRLMFSSEKSMK